MEPLFDARLSGGRTVRLGPLDAAGLACLTAQWQKLLAAGLDAGLLGEDARAEAADHLRQDALPEGDLELLTCAPSWILSDGTCVGDGTCCEVSELGLVLSLLEEDERSGAASAHVAAIAQTAAHLHGAVVWMLGEPDASGTALETACVACLCDPYPHARTLEAALGQLGQQLALASTGWDLNVQVTSR